ncbi:fructosamine kinase family protein [Mycobacterium interjectum]|uniref:fructosamine kinase family protein n=1 Tax=Mycobacterium interjectum TaxID=33895 RepID=UPI0021F355C9|nr:fructosamine kinase family protein [Mycobacterium interjectum]
MTDFVKRHPDAPAGYFAWEAAGLGWLAEVDGGVQCAQVVSVAATSLTLRRLESVRPSAEAADAFGSRLAVTHDAGAAEVRRGTRRVGRGRVLRAAVAAAADVAAAAPAMGRFLRRRAAGPMAELAAARLDASTRAAIDAVAARCRAGDFDDDDRPARLHGDLWSGNVMWTPDGVVLIDPAAHAGHRETDLAMLALFGCPHYDAVLGGYQRVRSLKPGWRNRIGLHQLFPLLAHVVLFGGGYARQTDAAARAALAA